MLPVAEPDNVVSAFNRETIVALRRVEAAIGLPLGGVIRDRRELVLDAGEDPGEHRQRLLFRSTGRR